MCVSAVIATDDRVILPTHVIPKHYRLTLTPNLVEFTFQGIVEVDLDVREESDTVIVNAKELQIQSGKITFSSAKSQQSYSLSFLCNIIS